MHQLILFVSLYTYNAKPYAGYKYIFSNLFS